MDRETYPKRPKYLLTFMEFVDYSSDMHSSIQTTLHTLLNISRTQYTLRGAPTIQTSKITQEEWTMHQYERVIVSEVEDVALALEEGDEEGDVERVCVEEAGEVCAPGEEVGGELLGEGDAGLEGRGADGVDIAEYLGYYFCESEVCISRCACG